MPSKPVRFLCYFQPSGLGADKELDHRPIGSRNWQTIETGRLQGRNQGPQVNFFDRSMCLRDLHHLIDQYGRDLAATVGDPPPCNPITIRSIGNPSGARRIWKAYGEPSPQRVPHLSPSTTTCMCANGVPGATFLHNGRFTRRAEGLGRKLEIVRLAPLDLGGFLLNRFTVCLD